MPFIFLFLTTGGVILRPHDFGVAVEPGAKNASIVDIFWGIGFILIAWIAFSLTPQGYLPRKQLIAILVTIWGWRLASAHRHSELGHSLKTIVMQNGARRMAGAGGGFHSFKYFCFKAF